jgi:hypothetical protein
MGRCIPRISRMIKHVIMRDIRRSRDGQNSDGASGRLFYSRKATVGGIACFLRLGDPPQPIANSCFGYRLLSNQGGENMHTKLLAALIAGSVLASSSPSYTHAQTPSQTEIPVEKGALASMLEMLILQKGVDIMVQNVKASERESGDINKAIRATLGVSVKDINQYGLLGGPNSEMRKLFKALGLS